MPLDFSSSVPFFAIIMGLNAESLLVFIAAFFLTLMTAFVVNKLFEQPVKKGLNNKLTNL